MPQNEEKLAKIYRLMYEKLTQIQLSNAFERTMEENREFSYVGKDNDYFFSKMVSVIFESGVRAVVWKKYEPEIRKEFANYNVREVAQYTEKDVERMLNNPKMFKNRRKIEACIHNAKEIVKLSKQFSGFSNFLSQPIPILVEELKERFKHFGYINAYAFLKYVGAEVIKPDSNVRRTMYRLGLIDSDIPNPKTYKQIQEVGEKMAQAVGVRVIEIDYLFYIYGSGGVKFTKYQICGEKPKCEECPLTKYCQHNNDRERQRMARYFDSATQKLASKVLRVAERLVRNSFVHKMSRKTWNKYFKQIYISLEDNKDCLRMMKKKKAYGMITEESNLKKIEEYASHFGEWVKEYRILVNACIHDKNCFN